MSFSAILAGGQLLGGLFGASKASKQAKQAAALQREQLALQRRQVEEQERYARLSWDMMVDENEYQRSWEQQNRLLNEQERAFELENISQYRDASLDLYSDDVARQVEADREAARIRTLRLEQLTRNQSITEQERNFALSELKKAQAIAEGERDEDLQRYYEERSQKEQERGYFLDQYDQQRNVAREEKNMDLAVRERYTDQLGGMQDAIRNASRSLGFMPEAPEIDPAELEREILRRTNDYQADVDRAGDRVASQNEANLIRSGIDASTAGDSRRGDVAARLASEYKDARNRAYQDALNYISGKQDLMMKDFNADLGRRQSYLNEVMGVEGAGLEELRSIPGYTSEMDAFRMASSAPSALYSRNIQSAGDYRAPVNINSAIYDNLVTDIGPAMSQYQVSDGNYLAGLLERNNARSGIYEPTQMNIPSASTYFSNSMTGGANLYNSASALAANSQRRADAGWNSVGDTFQKLLNDNSDSLSTWWSNRSGTSNAPTQSSRPPTRF